MDAGGGSGDGSAMAMDISVSEPPTPLSSATPVPIMSDMSGDGIIGGVSLDLGAAASGTGATPPAKGSGGNRKRVKKQ
jgi:hypothetical protein